MSCVRGQASTEYTFSTRPFAWNNKSSSRVIRVSTPSLTVPAAPSARPQTMPSSTARFKGKPALSLRSASQLGIGRFVPSLCNWPSGPGTLRRSSPKGAPWQTHKATGRTSLLIVIACKCLHHGAAARGSTQEATGKDDWARSQHKRMEQQQDKQINVCSKCLEHEP